MNVFVDYFRNITYMATDNSGHHMLLGSCTDDTVRMWKVKVTPGDIPANLSQNFSAVWPKNKQLPIIATPTNRNSIKVIHYLNLLPTLTKFIIDFYLYIYSKNCLCSL